MHLLNRLPFRALWVGLAIAGVMASRADELRLANGDRISGDLIRQDDSRVVFRSPVLGTLDLAAEQVAEVIKSLPASDLADPAAAEAAKAVAAVTPPASPEPKPTAPKAPDAQPKPKSRAESTAWSGKLELGYRQYDGKRDDTNFDFRASAEKKIGPNDLKAAARLLYGKQSEKVTTERYDASFRWRRELGERTFAQSLTSYYRDPIKDILNNLEQNVGAGYRLLKTDDHVVNVGAGLTAQYRTSEFDDGSVYALVELFQDYSYQINKRVKFSQNAVAQYSPDGQSRFITVNNQPSQVSTGESNYKLRFDTALQGKLTDSISLNLRFEYEFDNAVVTESARADQRITSSIGYGF